MWGEIAVDDPLVPRVRIEACSVTYLARYNPWIPVWWSAALPGFGHLMMGQHLKGLIFMSWEIIVNQQAHLNLAIHHTLLGQTDLARSVVDYEWLLIYPLFYIFCMFDAYRKCHELNTLARAERFQPHRDFGHVSISWLSVTTLSRRSPVMAALWSACVPGFGQLYNDRALRAFSLMGWYFAVVLQSGLAKAALHTLWGEFQLVPGVLDYQWLLFWPSIYVFGIADAYADAAEQNRLVDDAFRWRMRKYLRNGLQ